MSKGLRARSEGPSWQGIPCHDAPVTFGAHVTRVTIIVSEQTECGQVVSYVLALHGRVLGVQNGGAAYRDDHPLAGGHLDNRAVRASRLCRIAVRGIIAAALAGLTLSGLVMVPGAARAEAPLETPGADSITFNRSEGRIGAAVLNDSGTDRTTVVADNSYFGIVPGVTVYNSADPNQRSVAYRAGYSQDWLDANTAKSGDYWCYVTRGVAWDYHMAWYYQYSYDGSVAQRRPLQAGLPRLSTAHLPVDCSLLCTCSIRW